MPTLNGMVYDSTSARVTSKIIYIPNPVIKAYPAYLDQDDRRPRQRKVKTKPINNMTKKNIGLAHNEA